MIPGMVGKNIGKWIEEGTLPRTVSTYGVTPKEIFVSYDEIKERFGHETDAIPLGAIGLYTYCQKFKTGLQQLMAGSRKFNIGALSRRDLMALTKDAAKVSELPYVMDAHREEAERILQERWERQ
jgi:glutamate synthase domain-containing protein 2